MIAGKKKNSTIENIMKKKAIKKKYIYILRSNKPEKKSSHKTEHKLKP